MFHYGLHLGWQKKKKKDSSRAPDGWSVNKSERHQLLYAAYVEEENIALVDVSRVHG